MPWQTVKKTLYYITDPTVEKFAGKHKQAKGRQGTSSRSSEA